MIYIETLPDLGDALYPYKCDYWRAFNYLDKNSLAVSDVDTMFRGMVKWLEDNISSNGINYRWSNITIIFFTAKDRVSYPRFVAFADETDLLAFKLVWGIV